MHHLAFGINFLFHSVNLVLTILLHTLLDVLFSSQSSKLISPINHHHCHRLFNTYLFRKSFPPQTSPHPQNCGLPSRTARWFSFSLSITHFSLLRAVWTKLDSRHLSVFAHVLNIIDWLIDWLYRLKFGVSLHLWDSSEDNRWMCVLGRKWMNEWMNDVFINVW